MNSRTRGIVALGAMTVLILAARDAEASDLATLVDWMTGSFSSEQQAAADSNYYDNRLEMVGI